MCGRSTPDRHHRNAKLHLIFFWEHVCASHCQQRPTDRNRSVDTSTRTGAPVTPSRRSKHRVQQQLSHASTLRILGNKAPDPAVWIVSKPPSQTPPGVRDDRADLVRSVGRAPILDQRGRLGIVVAVALVVVPVIGANARQEATHHSDSRYHSHHERRNEQRKPDRTMVVGMPSNHGEQQDRDKQHDVAPVAFLGEISGPTAETSDSSLAPRGGRRRAVRSFARARLDGLPRSSGSRCSRSSSDVMTARKSATNPANSLCPPCRRRGHRLAGCAAPTA